MSQIFSYQNLTTLPALEINSTTTNSTTNLNGSGYAVHMTGTIMLENPLGGTKTISAAGGGSIVWVAGAVTFSNGSSVFKVGIQDVSTVASPAQGDGTFDVYAQFTGGGGGVSANTTNTSVMTSGTKTISHGDLISVVMEMTTRGGTDLINVTRLSDGIFTTTKMPCVTTNTSGSFVDIGNSAPKAYIVFDDGTIGWFFGVNFTIDATSTVNYNSGTGTADEYGNLIINPFTFYATGIGFFGSVAGNSSDAELLLYSDPLGTPVAERTITMDATQISLTTTAENSSYAFPVPFMLRANTPYGITIRPTTANNITIYYDNTNSSVGGKTGAANGNCYAIRRLDNTGAFSDYNGGTVKTRRMSVYLIGTYMEQGVNVCSGQIGVF